MNGKGKANNKRNGSKRNYMGNRKAQRNDRSRDTMGCDGNASHVRNLPDNDVAWYANSGQLLTDSASLAYSNPVGKAIEPITSIEQIDIVSVDYLNLNYIPGVMSIGYVPTVGISLDNSSPINIAARNIYSYVRHANSGHSNYDSPDLMLYILAMGNLYSAYAWMTRIYGVSQLYSQKNRVYPKGIVTAMNVDFDDILNNLANFRYYINVIAKKLNSLAVPSSMSYFDRQIWMNSNIFVDDPGAKAQTYIYNPDVFFKFEPTKYETGGCLTPIKVGARSTVLKLADIQDIVNSMLAAVIESEDMNIMSGDILKAFGSSIYTIHEMSENHTVLPVYSMEVLSQIQNTTCNGWMHVNTYSDIKQNEYGAILFDPVFNGWQYGDKRLLNMYKDDVTPGDTMVATRLMNIARREDGQEGTYNHKLDTCGSEIATEMRIYFPRYNSDEGTHDATTFGNEWGYLPLTYSEVIFDIRQTEVPGSFYGAVTALNLLTKFDFHPYVTTYAYVNGYGSEFEPLFRYTGILGDVDNYTVVDEYTLEKMHETALLSEFSVPSMGTFASRK